MSVNDVVSNYSPFPSDSKTLEAGDVVKVDMGCHIDGYVAMAANTVIIPSEKMEEARKTESSA